MKGVDWFWLTVIVLILAIKTGDILCYYWKCRYGTDKDSKVKQENKEVKTSSRKVIAGFSKNK